MISIAEELGLQDRLGDIPAAALVLQQFRDKRDEQASDHVSRTTILYVVGLFDATVRACLERSGLMWDRFRNNIGAEGFEVPKTLPTGVDLALSDAFKDALVRYAQEFRDAHPVLDGRALAYAIVHSAPQRWDKRLEEAGANVIRLRQLLQAALRDPASISKEEPEDERGQEQRPREKNLRDAYRKIRAWYQANNRLLEGKDDEYSDRSRRLIRKLPEPSSATELEMRAVMAAVVAGSLEWGYGQSDGDRTMSQYAKEAVEPYGGYQLSESDAQVLQSSILCPYLGYTKVPYYLERAAESLAANDLQLSEEWLNRALAEARDQGDLPRIVEVEIRLADLLTRTSRFNRAVEYCEEALQLSGESNDLTTRQQVFLRLGNLYETLGRLDDAESIYKTAVAGAREISANQPLADALERLSSVYQAKGRTKESEEARREASTVRSQVALEQPEEAAPGATLSSPEPLRSASSSMAAPTPKIISDRWCDRDALGYEAYARTIAALITHKETVPPLTIGIKAPWGAGKTSLMKMVQHILDGDAEVTEENLAARRNRREEPVLTLRGLLKNLKAASTPQQLVPKPGDWGKRYAIPARVTVWFNAWKYQTSEQIWAGLAHCIISQVTARMAPSNREVFWLKLHARRVDTNKVRQQAYELVLRHLLPFALAAVVISVTAILLALVFPQVFLLRFAAIGTPLASAAGLIWKGRVKFGEKAAGAFRDLVREPNYEGKLGFLYLVESDIRDVLDLVATRESPLVIFVDDLDRCVPHKVAEVVEAINLSLCGDYPNCIFVMAMEPGMVAAALEVANKDVIEKAKQLSLVETQVPLGWRFMEKIVQLPVIVPPPTSMGIDDYTRSLAGLVPDRYQASPAAASAPEIKVQEFIKAFENSRSVSEVVSRTEDLLQAAPAADKAAIAEASKRKYAERFTERDPAISRFIQSTISLFNGNPRQIKRYVNTFRFASTLRHNLRLDFALHEGNRVPLPSDEALTKFIALSIHWPQAIDCLRNVCGVKRDDATAEQSISFLALLEERSRSLATVEPEQADKQWVTFLKESSPSLGEWAASRAFREFVARGESVGNNQGCGLW